jgi:hypothetical protein
MPEHPLKIALRNAPRLSKGSVSKEAIAQFEESRRLQVAGLEKFISLEQVMRQRKKS